jgi:elongation factor 2
LSKSQNRHNRLYAVAEPLGEEFCKAIDEKVISGRDDPKELSKVLVERFGWDINDTKKLWTFGPDETGPNVLVDQTKGVQYVQEIKDSMMTSFYVASQSGAMAQEGLRGVRFNLVDANLISDSIHRGGGQMLPAARRVYYAS